MNDFGLSEMEMNLSFTDLLNRPEMNKNFEEDIGLVGLNVAAETVVSHEALLNEIDYDENGSDVDDDELIDARTKHKQNEIFEKESQIFEKESQLELERLGEQFQRDNVRYDIDSDYDDEFDVNSPTASSEEDEYGYLTTTSMGQNSKPRKANVESSSLIDTTFFVEQKFENAVEFKKEIVDYCARNGVNFRYTKNDANRVGVKCKDDNCEWKIWASFGKNKQHFEVKTYYGVHSCGRKNKVKMTYKWIVRHYFTKFKSNPYIKLQEIIDSVWNEHGLKVSLHMAFRAKKCALNLIVGEYKEQYGVLNSYAAEIYRSDHNNTIKFQLNANVFHRMYICFAALREGFLAGCRPFISIDGCWLKGPYGGQLLVAVGRDGNNQMFPIAWAVVDVENTETWSWFLQLLAEDLGTFDGAGYTIMSDQQKGLLKAVAETWPQAEQRVCARHVYMNFREVFGGGLEYRLHFWKIAKSTTPNEFKENIDKLGAISPEAAADLMGRNYEKWCRAFYTPQCQCDAVDNNMSEVFNAYILNSRHKPIITMLEDIREAIMDRLHKKRDFIRSKNLAICPRAQEQLEKAKINARGWNSIYGGRFTIGVREGATQVRYVVDLLNKTCSCNAWQLSGIPCNHSVAAIWHNKERPEAYVAECYKKNMYLKAYDYLLEPLNGPKEWPPSQQPPIIAPILKKVKVGRPKKSRRPGPGENSKTKKSRIGTTCTCSICGMVGHNIRGCKLAKTKQAGSKKRIGSSGENSGKTSSDHSQATNPPMHNRGFGMYTYPNGFQRRGNMNARSGNSVQETHVTPQNRQRATQVRQVAYYSDFEGEQTLRGITAMQGADTFIQSQNSFVSNDDVPSFVDSRGRKCIPSSTLQSWARK